MGSQRRDFHSERAHAVVNSSRTLRQVDRTVTAVADCDCLFHCYRRGKAAGTRSVMAPGLIPLAASLITSVTGLDLSFCAAA